MPIRGPDWAPIDKPVRVPVRLMPSEQQFAAFYPTPVVPFSWFEPLSEPVRVPARLMPSEQQFSAAPPRLLPNPNITGTLAAIETKDLFPGGGMRFNAPRSGEVGVIETTFTGMPGVVEKPAPGTAAISGGSISVSVKSS
jgi:hypothetical protein